MTLPTIPKATAWLCYWPEPAAVDPTNTAAPARLNVMAHDGPLPADREAKLKAIGGWWAPACDADTAELYERIATSPGWVDDRKALEVFASLDRDPELRVQMRANIERRAAMVRHCKTWQEAVAVLAEAGEMMPATVRAVAA